MTAPAETRSPPLPAAEHEPARRAGRSRISSSTVLIFLLAVGVLPAVLVPWAATQNTTYSPLDEVAHVDYLRRVGQGEIPRIGDRVEDATVATIGCRGIAGQFPIECGEADVDLDFLAEGYQYEAQQPPGYYLVTAALAALVRLGPVEDLVVAGRLVGAFWLSAGLATVWLALRRLGASVPATAVAVALSGLSPLVVVQSATVNNDAATLLIGGASLLAFERLRRDPGTRVVAAVTVGALAAVLVKPLALLPIGAVALGLVVDGRRRGRSWPALATAAGPPVAASVLGYLGWSFVRDARATVDYSVVIDALLSFDPPLDAFPIDEILNGWAAYFSVYSATVSGRTYESYAVNAIVVVGLLVVLSPLLRTLVDRGGKAAFRSLAAGYLTVALAAPPALLVLSYVTAERVRGVNTRYGIALIPILALGVAHAFDEHRPYRRTALAGTALLLVLTAVALADLAVP